MRGCSLLRTRWRGRFVSLRTSTGFSISIYISISGIEIVILSYVRNDVMILSPHSRLLTRPAARFLYNNYRQALSIMAEYTPIVEDYKAVNKLCDDDFESWRNDELAYLQRLVKEPEEDISKVAYFEALEALNLAQYVVHHPPYRFLDLKIVPEKHGRRFLRLHSS